MESDPEAPPRPAFVIVDHDISPSQARNLERATGAQVLARTGVIVEIFHRHAHSREAKPQVEMARLSCFNRRTFSTESTKAANEAHLRPSA